MSDTTPIPDQSQPAAAAPAAAGETVSAAPAKPAAPAASGAPAPSVPTKAVASPARRERKPAAAKAASPKITAPKPVVAEVPAAVAAPVAKPAARRSAPVKAVRAAKAVAPKSPALKSPAVVAKPRRVANPEVKAPAAKTPVKSKTSITPNPRAAKPVAALPQSKDKIMATKTPIDFTAAFKTTFADFQEKAKTAYEKSSTAFGEANEFAKGNVEALVESGKILASGLQELGTTLTTESRSAFENLTAEAKDLAAVKSPTEFFQLQSSLLRKHFDAAVAQTSKNTEAMIKLANEAFSPISTRITLAVEKASKAA